MSLYAQLSDVEAWAAHPIPLDRADDVQALITEAEVELSALYGDLADRITAGLTTADKVTTAVVSMVIRAINQHRAMVAAGGSDCSLVACLSVTRRERVLLGVSGSASSISLSAGDVALRYPLRRTHRRHCDEDWGAWPWR